MAEKSEKSKALETALSQIEKNFGKGAIMRLGENAGMNIEAATWVAYIHKLAEVAGVEINSFDTLIEALQKRHDFFESMGCRLSDHGIEEFYDEPYTDAEVNTIFQKALTGKELTTY